MARDFLSELESFGETLENMDNILLGIAGGVVRDLKATAPVDTGDLKNSIQAVVEGNSLKIAMLEYGSFQNYGVAGTEGDSRYGVVLDVPAGVLPPPLRSSKYQYKERAFGIPAQSWYNFEALSNRILTEIANRTEL